MKRVLVIGGYGGFGARLCRRLVDDGWQVIVAGRSLAKAQALATTLDNASAMIVDREEDMAPPLADASPFLVIDAAGPFQNCGYRLPEACAASGVHYLDLADAREFVTGIGELDKQAKQNGVTIISGASSVPALSGAVLRELSDGLETLTRVDMAISASDKTAAGASVAAAILSYVGQPLRIWRGRQWSQQFGWQHLQRVSVTANDGTRMPRLVASADIPDLEIVPRSLPGEPSTTFSAGPEFRFQVITLWLLSWLVRWKLLGSLTRLRRLLLPLQKLTSWFSNGDSFMSVKITGQNKAGLFLKREWHLIAREGRGPEIPVMAAQLLAQELRDGELPPSARHAGETLTLEQFQPLFEELKLEQHRFAEEYHPLYRRIMGEAFDRLPEPIRAMHTLCGDGGASGTATVTRGRSILARLVATIMRFPDAGEHSLHVAFREDKGREVWTRDFGGSAFHSELSEKNGKLVERFGPLRFRLDLPSNERGLSMVMVGWTAFGIPLPLFLAPKTVATEAAEDGVFVFDVAIALPLIGDIVHYRGSLKPWSSAPI